MFLLQIKIQFEQPKASGIAIACYLAQEGANLDLRNKAGKTALELCEDPNIKDLIWQFKRKGEQPRTPQPQPRHKEAAATADAAAEKTGKICRLCGKEADAILKPCGHDDFCFECGENFKKCPICKVGAVDST